jgi:phosphatidylglycerophosphatase C
MTPDAVGPHKTVLAVFDFDGTLTAGDTSLPFVLYALGSAGGWRTLLPLAPLFGLDFVTAVWEEKAPGRGDVLGGVRGRWEAKVHQRLLRRCFSGMAGDRLRELGEGFARQEVERFVRPAGLARLRWHREQGHCCVLISASIDLYLEPWGRRVGFDHVLGTSLEFDETGAFTGRFATESCWGRAKVRRLSSHFGSLGDYTLYAYGDSAGDRALLTIADHGFLVRGDFELIEQ